MQGQCKPSVTLLNTMLSRVISLVLHGANRPHMFIAFWLAESPSLMPYHPRVSYLMLSVHLYLSLLLI
jgi:hypothetical protein